ncbi:TMV resistance protein N-like protein [Tanacetum coccineum]
MGGSGKTTIAKHVLDSNWAKFENISILEDIGKRCKESHGCLLQLQQLLLGDILGGKRRKIPSVCRATLKVEEALQMKKALVLLDDNIVEPSQLVALLGTGNTVLINKARSEVPMNGFEELALQAVQYCDGNPLALEVLGSSLHESNTIPFWKSHLKLLESDMNHKIQHVLMRSYESLPYNSERELFLHIACFFVGIDTDYVVKILEHDYSAISGIKALTNRCLLSVSPSKKLIMHRLLQEMGKAIVRQESYKDAAKRSRVIGNDSYEILCKGKGSETIEGLALDMRLQRAEKVALKSKDLKTNALTNMDRLKLLQLNFVELTGPLENFSEDLRWLCWFGFYLRTIPSDIFMRKLVAIDMSCSKLEVFDPPVLECLQILNLKDSYDLLKINNIFRFPNLDTLIVWNCHNLVHVCETIGGLRNLVEVNLTGCLNLGKYSGEHIIPSKELKSSVFGEGSSRKPSLDFPCSLERLFLKDCNIECCDYFPLSFSDQSSLQYLKLGNGLFVVRPNYTHLKNLRVLDLSFCSKLRWLLRLPSTLVELYVYYCESLEIVSFELQQFTLQEFGYEGCSSLSEIEGFLKLVPLSKLNEIDLGHMNWLKDHQHLQIRLVGDNELTIGRDWCAQMLYEFDIISISLPNIMDLNMTHEYTSQSSSLSFEVPPCPRNRRLKGLNVTFKYTLQYDDDWAWFAKISTANGVDLMYNPKVFGKPEFGEVGLWLSYWPIGNMLNVGDKVHVSIRAWMNGFMVLNCGASLVFTDDDLANASVENNMRPFGGDLSGFQLSTGAYYLCRHDFFELMETGQPQLPNPSITELKTVRCIIHGPEMLRFANPGVYQNDIYKIAKRVKSFVRAKELSTDKETLKPITIPELSYAANENGGELKENKFMFESPIGEEPEDTYNQLLDLYDIELYCLEDLTDWIESISPPESP